MIATTPMARKPRPTSTIGPVSAPVAGSVAGAAVTVSASTVAVVLAGRSVVVSTVGPPRWSAIGGGRSGDGADRDGRGRHCGSGRRRRGRVVVVATEHTIVVVEISYSVLTGGGRSVTRTVWVPFRSSGTVKVHADLVTCTT